MSKPTCSVDDCDNLVLARGWCNKHYLRWQKYGDVLHPVQAQVHGGTALDRYWAKVDTSAGPDGCWPWKGYRERYGIFWNGERRTDGAPVMVKAHRWTYEHFVGLIDDGLVVCHHCDNPPCVNPAHLFLGTRSDNMQDMVRKGRNPSVSEAFLTGSRHLGEANPATKLTADVVLQLRGRYAAGGISQQQLAAEHGVNQTTISQIIRRQTWTHI